MLSKKSNIFLSGHRGLVGSAIFKKLKEHGYKNIFTRTRNQLDLRNQKKVLNFFKKNKFTAVINAAAKVGGIYANNKYRADFIYDNLSIQNNIIHSSFLTKVKSLIFLGSSCVYPRNCRQPIKEEYLLNNYLEYTNEPYAIAKIAGIKMCENYNLQYNTNFKCLMPANLYGPNDNYNPETSHFLPALIRKAMFLKDSNKRKYILKIWGNGKTKREVLYVDDLASACVYFMNKKIDRSISAINIGSGVDFPINYYAKKILKILRIERKTILKYDKTKPTGTYRKLLDSSIARSYGWAPKISLEEGLIKTILGDDQFKLRR